MEKYTDIKYAPRYSQDNKLIGWGVWWTVLTDYYDIDAYRFFKETWFRDSYRAMCRFQKKLLKRNENNK